MIKKESFEMKKLKEIHEKMNDLRDDYSLLEDGIKKDYKSDYDKMEDTLLTIERELYLWIYFMEQ